MKLTIKQLDTLSAQLACCPFCGSRDVSMLISEDEKLRIECNDFDCCATVVFHAGALFSPSITLARWNRRKQPKKSGFEPPTVEEVRAYCEERGNGIKADSFVDYYAARGWKLSNGCKVKDWKALVRRWEQYQKEQSRTSGKAGKSRRTEISSIDERELEKFYGLDPVQKSSIDMEEVHRMIYVKHDPEEVEALERELAKKEEENT